MTDRGNNVSLGGGLPEAGTLDSLADGFVVDYITGDPVKEDEKEKVRQRVARALFVEYGISVEDMGRDFPIPVVGPDGRKRTRKADIAIFSGDEHTLAQVRRVVVCKPEPKNGNTVTKIRTFKQAERDLDELKAVMGYDEHPQISYGLWTNGLDLFFLHKEVGRFAPEFHPRADWPLADETVGTRRVASHARLRRGEAGMLKTVFRRCHNYIHGNQGMPKDAAFWQFLYLLYSKMHDERLSRESKESRFFAGFEEPFTKEGQEKIRKRVLDLFADVKLEYPLFGQSDEITLSPSALAFLVAELAPYDLTNTDIDAKGLAYQELVGTNLRGDRGQYFTPRGAVKLMVDILDPTEHETVLDPACGTGGFLRETLRHLLDGWRERDGTLGQPDNDDQRERFRKRLHSYADQHLFGADFDPFLVRATKLSIMLLTEHEGNAYYMDSLAFPIGDLPGNDQALENIPLGSVDVVMTNPPFGTDIKITDTAILDQFRRDGVAQAWRHDPETGQLVLTDTVVSAVAPEQLFIQRAIEWVKPGGRVGIVLPNGILSNPGAGDRAIREWILHHCWVLASVELPVETFIVDAGVNILTTLLFLKKKTEHERMAETLRGPVDYPVFMAVAEKVGVDRRGNPVYERQPDGEIVVRPEEERESIRIRGKEVVRTLTRKVKVDDNDLPKIAHAYWAFRQRHLEPGQSPGTV